MGIKTLIVATLVLNALYLALLWYATWDSDGFT